MSSLNDLPNLGGGQKRQEEKQDADFDFGDFEDFDNEESGKFNNQQNNSRFSNAEKYLDDFENEERDGFKVEVQRPNQKKGNASTTSGKKKK